MNYSEVRKVRAVNFRSIGSVEIDFTDCPIVALTGSNESGKSSFVRAFGAIAGNLWRAKQNQYIRTGTDGFAVLMELGDGTKIMRKKTSSINGYTLILPDGTRRDAAKIDVEVPDYIEAVMGMFRDSETRESLQVRTYDDPLLFVGTTDGQNYKAIHNAINNLDVREATIAAKADAARLNSEVEKKCGEIEVFNRQLSELPLLDTDYLKVILSAMERTLKNSTRFDDAARYMEVVKTLDGADYMKRVEKCKIVDTALFRAFTEAARHIASFRIADVAYPDGAEMIDVHTLSLLERGCSLVTTVKSHFFAEIPDEVIMVSTKIFTLFEKAIRTTQAAREASESYEKRMAGIDTVTERIKASGVHVVICDQCGNTIAVSTEVM